MQLSNGGFPSQRGFPERDGYLSSVKILVHWCHGAPGAIAPFLAASELFLKIAKQERQQEAGAAAEGQADDDNRALILARKLY